MGTQPRRRAVTPKTSPKRIPAPQLAAGSCHRWGTTASNSAVDLTLALDTQHAPPPNRSEKAEVAASSRPDDPGRSESAAVELGAEPPDLEPVAHIARDEYAILVAHHH